MSKPNRVAQAFKRARDRTPKRRDRPHESNPLRLYRPSRLAALFGVDASTIWRWKQSGVLPEPAARFPSGFEAWTEAQIADLIHGEAKR